MGEQSRKRRLADVAQEVLDKYVSAEHAEAAEVIELQRRLKDYFVSRSATVRAHPEFDYAGWRQKKRRKGTARRERKGDMSTRTIGGEDGGRKDG